MKKHILLISLTLMITTPLASMGDVTMRGVLHSYEVLEVFEDKTTQGHIDLCLSTLEEKTSASIKVQEAVGTLKILLAKVPQRFAQKVALQQFLTALLYHILYTHEEVRIEEDATHAFLALLHATNSGDTSSSDYCRAAISFQDEIKRRRGMSTSSHSL